MAIKKKRLSKLSTYSSPSFDFATEAFDTREELVERDFFDSLSRHVRERVLEKMDARQFATGELLIRQGDDDSPLLYLTSGRAEVFTTNKNGERHHIAACGPGDVIGEMSLLTGEPSTANVIALEEVHCQALPPAHFHKLATNHHQICEVLTRVVAKRLGGEGRDVLAGKRLAGHHIRQTLGQGGMGIVYRALSEATGEDVALKMMSHRFAYDSKAVAQFQREAEVIEKFDHINIVKMQGTFTAFHTQFIVMEFCDGVTLGNLVKFSGALSVEEFRFLFGQLVAAVRHAHEAGIVHRDIKPANVMILRDGTAKLMDFGLAVPSADAALGQGAGTVGYSAPEQLLGNRVSKQADYWALGCVAHEMLTGERLFSGQSPADIVRKYEYEDPQSEADVPAVLRSCFAKDPTQRALDLDPLAAWAEEFRSAGQLISRRVADVLAIDDETG